MNDLYVYILKYGQSLYDNKTYLNIVVCSFLGKMVTFISYNIKRNIFLVKGALAVIVWTTGIWQ